MQNIKTIFPALDELVLLGSACACMIHKPEGYVYGTKLTGMAMLKIEE